MKHRSGFVSNSSSSSFIIAFKRTDMPNTVEDMERILFPNGLSEEQRYYDEVTPEMKAKQAYEDTHDDDGVFTEESLDELADTLSHGWSPCHLEWNPPEPPDRNWSDPEFRKAYDAYNAQHKKDQLVESAKYLQRFMEEYPVSEWAYTTVHYADDEGVLMADMEHGDTFIAIPHIHISHH